MYTWLMLALEGKHRSFYCKDKTVGTKKTDDFLCEKLKPNHSTNLPAKHRQRENLTSATLKLALDIVKRPATAISS